MLSSSAYSQIWLPLEFPIFIRYSQTIPDKRLSLSWLYQQRTITFFIYLFSKWILCNEREYYEKIIMRNGCFVRTAWNLFVSRGRRQFLSLNFSSLQLPNHLSLPYCFHLCHVWHARMLSLFYAFKLISLSVGTQIPSTSHYHLHQ